MKPDKDMVSFANDALCVWEEMLRRDEQRGREERAGHYPSYRDKHGVVATRDQVVTRVVPQLRSACESLYKDATYASSAIIDAGFFDWDFVPAYLDVFFDEETCTCRPFSVVEMYAHYQLMGKFD